MRLQIAISTVTIIVHALSVHMNVHLGYKPRNEKAGSEGVHFFFFTRYCQVVFQNSLEGRSSSFQYSSVKIFQIVSPTHHVRVCNI